MRFEELPLQGAFLVHWEPLRDERGFFARTWCEEEFAARGLEARTVQVNLSHNVRRGTLRGLHYQAAPHAEAKVVTCLRGALWDVVVDLREGSPTRRRWHAVELRAGAPRSLYVPKGFAHGFQTLEDDTLLLYQMSDFYHPASARGVRWDDPSLAIPWPQVPPPEISERDRAHPLLGSP